MNFPHRSLVHRRTFLRRCGLFVAGSVFAASIFTPGQPSWAASPSSLNARQMTPGDRNLLQVLSAYSTDAYFWGSQVFARATGSQTTNDTTNLLVRVDDYSRLVAFLRSGSVKALGRMTVANNTLSFRYQGAAYTVTNAATADFNQAVANGGVSRDHLTAAGVFAHQTLLYHPATDTLRDPHFAASGKRLELVEAPTGGTAARMQTLLQGWLEARRQGLDFGPSFKAFQREFLDRQPTAKSASKIVLALLGNVSELAGVYDLDELGSLLTSPLISASLQEALDLDAAQAVADAQALRAEPTLASYPDAAIWLATLLPTQIAAGTGEAWLAAAEADPAAEAATRAALPLAQQLVSPSAPASVVSRDLR